MPPSRLRDAFDEAFWCDDLANLRLGARCQKQPCRVRTSNAGHCLFSGIAAPKLCRSVAKTLLGEDSFSGWGIRTVSTRRDSL